ncbi:MAG: aminomethyl-transferring glycine dehydrogenase subunit GcvPA [bacterium]
MPFVPNTSKNEQDILNALGIASFEELLSDIPTDVRIDGNLDLPPQLSELEAVQLLRRLAGRNKNLHEYACFIGGGAYDHYVPTAVDHIISRSEFYTAYTPYQPEVSQGTLQAGFEYQSMICELTGMEVTNSSLYDGGSSLAEAVLVLNGIKPGKRMLVSAGINPHYRKIMQTYAWGQRIELIEIPLSTEGVTDLDRLESLASEPTAGVFVQHPNFFGNLENVNELEEIAHAAEASYVVSVDPLSLGILSPPGVYGADIVTGEGQVFGNQLNFGGPYLGIFCVNKELVRKLPGRLIGETVDLKGRRGFVMTLRTREQDIRREKATSNICTNQALNALAATVYLSLLGKQGIKEVAEHCLQKSHYLVDQITQLGNFSSRYSGPYFKEFVLNCPVNAADVIDKLKEDGILAGLDLGRFYPDRKNQLLVAVTEKRSKAELDGYVSALEKHFST